jgi:hypothetical protein
MPEMPIPTSSTIKRVVKSRRSKCRRGEESVVKEHNVKALIRYSELTETAISED